jgi:hypothetical protein
MEPKAGLDKLRHAAPCAVRHAILDLCGHCAICSNWGPLWELESSRLDWVVDNFVELTSHAQGFVIMKQCQSLPFSFPRSESGEGFTIFAKESMWQRKDFLLINQGVGLAGQLCFSLFGEQLIPWPWARSFLFALVRPGQGEKQEGKASR